MRWIGVLLAFIPATAYATQSSVICKTLDSNEYIQIVAKGSNTSEVLFQVSGGQFFDGMSAFDDPLYKVYIPLDNGSIILAYNVRTQAGGVISIINNQRQAHEISCVFR